PKPVQTVSIPDGPSNEAPVVLSKTWKPSLTIWTYCVVPTSPFVSGGAQLHATPGNCMPLKFAFAVGMFAAVNASAAIDVWTTRSGRSLCGCTILGFSFASFLGLKTGCCFISRTGADVSLRIDSPTVTSCLRPCGGLTTAVFGA